MNNTEIEFFPLSKIKEVNGNRRLVREKALQILIAKEISETSLDTLFAHIFYRDFTFDIETPKEGVLLRPDEIIELESDIPVKWKDEEVEFARNLINNCIDLRQFAEESISKDVENWEIDRLAMIDKTLILIAVAEFIRFPLIPEKVTINEVLDIAKKYSTPKSHIFINGILDSFRVKFKEQGLISKTGKGLIDK